MLDKQSEKVLKYAISKYNDSSQNLISFIDTDALLLQISIDKIEIICEDLSNNGYFFNFVKYIDEGCRVQLTNNGISYFETKRTEQLRFWIPVSISVISLISSFRYEITWLLTQLMQVLK